MRKYYSVFLIPAVLLAVLTGCRGNVSEQQDGKITEPTAATATAATMPTVATMPSTDTAPIDTMPSASAESTEDSQSAEATKESSMTDATSASDVPEQDAQQGRARHSRAKDPMQRN